MKTLSADVLVVDDESGVCSVIRDALRKTGVNCVTTQEAAEAKNLLDGRRFDVMVADVSLGGASGLDLLAYSRQISPHCKVILITGFPSTKCLADALTLGAWDFLSKPLNLDVLRDSVRRAATDDYSAALAYRAAAAITGGGPSAAIPLQSILALARAVEAKDPFTRRHSDQVAHYAVNLARHVGVDAAQIESIRIAALLHDVGKIGVPDYILAKPGELTRKEFQLIRRHPMLSYEILTNISQFSNEAKLARHHHERWDGTGYPDGLAGEAIPFGARLICVADSLDAMLMMRSYRRALPLQEAMKQLELCAGRQFDPTLAWEQIEWCRLHPEGLILCDGSNAPAKQGLLFDDHIFDPPS